MSDFCCPKTLMVSFFFFLFSSDTFWRSSIFKNIESMPKRKSFNILSPYFLFALLTRPLFHSFLLPPPPHMCMHTFVLFPSSTTALTGCKKNKEFPWEASLMKGFILIRDKIISYFPQGTIPCRKHCLVICSFDEQGLATRCVCWDNPVQFN